MVDRREDLVAQRTATMNRLLWRIHELDPTRTLGPSALNRAKHRDAVRAWLEDQQSLVAEPARDELGDITRLTEAINALEKRVIQRVAGSYPACSACRAPARCA